MPPNPLTAGPTNIQGVTRVMLRPPPRSSNRACSGRPSSRSSAARASTDYTLVHGRRQVRLGPVAFWIVVAQPGGDGRLVGADRHLFRLSRRRAEASDRPPGGDAIRLRGPDRRIARAGRPHHQPTIARPGAIRAEARTRDAQAIHAGATRGDARLASRIITTTGSIPKGGRASEAPKAALSQALPDQRHRHLPGARRTAKLGSNRAQSPVLNLRNAAKTRGGVEGALARMQESLDELEAKQSSVADRAGGELRRPSAPHSQRADRSRHQSRQGVAGTAPAGGRSADPSSRPISVRKRKSSSASFIASMSHARRSTG